jgi:magnesium-transporting ATPase (P-type)
VLQILSLDLLTDQLPALALGAEPPSPGVLRLPARRGHLVDASLLVRAFGVLGPTESLVELAAFTLVLLAAGWHPGAGPPSAPALAVASGTAFVAIVAGQSATAFACRSSSRSVLAVPLGTNPYLLVALPITWLLVASMLYVPWLAHPLGHTPPTGYGLLLAASAVPAVLLADSALKHWRARVAR